MQLVKVLVASERSQRPVGVLSVEQFLVTANSNLAVNHCLVRHCLVCFSMHFKVVSFTLDKFCLFSKKDILYPVSELVAL